MTDPEHGEYTLSSDHDMKVAVGGKLVIEGMELPDARNCFTMTAAGHRYHNYGIADGSQLLCVKTKNANPGDLVLVLEEIGKTAVYLYKPTQPMPEGSEMRVLNDREKIYARIIGSFNFYS